MLRRTSIVTGSPFATVSSSGASVVPSEYGLGGARTRTESRSSPIRVAAAVAAERREVRPAVPGRRRRPQDGLQQRLEGRVDGGADPGLGHGGRAQVEHVRAHLADRLEHRGRDVAAAGLQRVRGAPGGAGSRRPGGDDVPEPARPHPAGVEQQVHGGEQRAGARLVRAPHVRRSEDDRRRRRPVASRPGRGTRARRPRPGWPAAGSSRARTPWSRCRGSRGADASGASAARASRGSVSTASNDDDPTATGTAPAVSRVTAVHGRGVQHHRPGTGGGDTGERRLVEHSAAGPGGGVEHRRAEGLGDDRPPRRRRPAGRGRRAARGPARRGPRRRRAVRRRSRRARPPPACPARCPRPRRRCRAPSRSGRAPRSPAASRQRSRRGRGRRPGRSPPGRPNPAGAPSANAASSPPRRPSGASDRARSSSASSVCSPGTVGSRCGVSTSG